MASDLTAATPPGPMDPRRVRALARAATANGRWRRYQEAAARRGWDRERGRVEQRMDLLLAHGQWMGRVALLLRCGLWDLRLRNGLGGDPGPSMGVVSYALAGPDPKARPKALFDQAWYLGRHPDLEARGWCPLVHYLAVGDAQDLAPHPLFDQAAYRAEHAVKIAASGLTALQHYVYSGAREGCAPHPLFDTVWYVGQCEAVAESGENPLMHYLRQGWRDGLDPHPLFDGRWYLAHNPDAAEARIAPLLHYVLKGAARMRSPHPLFDAEWHAGRYGPGGLALLVASAETPQDPGPEFSSEHYLAQKPGLSADVHPLADYLMRGAFDGIDPSPGFSEAAYARAHPNVMEPGLLNWVRSGRPAWDQGVSAGAGAAG